MLALGAWAACNSNQLRPAVDGGPPEVMCPMGPPTCSITTPCASYDYCREDVSECPGFPVTDSPKVVTLVAACCRPLGAPCQENIDCAPNETCANGTCQIFPDQCGLVEPRCPPQCHWDKAPCACVCVTCPDAG